MTPLAVAPTRKVDTNTSVFLALFTIRIVLPRLNITPELTSQFVVAERQKTGRRAAVGYVSSSPSSDILSNWLLRRTVRIST